MQSQRLWELQNVLSKKGSKGEIRSQQRRRVGGVLVTKEGNWPQSLHVGRPSEGGGSGSAFYINCKNCARGGWGRCRRTREGLLRAALQLEALRNQA